MRAIGLTKFGGPEVLKVLELPEPHPGPGEVRVRVSAAAVNPTDTLIRAGVLNLADPPPYVPGMDVSGRIDEVGEGVADFSVGDAVMAIVHPSGARGGYSEYVVVPAGQVTAVPAGVDNAHACTLPMNGLTALRALDLLHVEQAESIAVTGAAGAVGGYVVQLAKAKGLQVVADASGADEALVEELGADIVVRRGDDVAARIREKVAAGVDVLSDNSAQGEKLVGAVRDGGRIAMVRPNRGPDVRGITWHMVLVREIEHVAERLAELRGLTEAGALTPRVAEVVPAGRAAEAHSRLEKGGVRGRLVLAF